MAKRRFEMSTRTSIRYDNVSGEFPFQMFDEWTRQWLSDVILRDVSKGGIGVSTSVHISPGALITAEFDGGQLQFRSVYSNMVPQTEMFRSGLKLVVPESIDLVEIMIKNGSLIVE